MTQQLKQCPFCGNSEPVVIIFTEDEQVVFCPGCEVETAVVEDATKLWNNRANKPDSANLSCPFCGSMDGSNQSVTADDESRHWRMCECCNAWGPSARTKTEAIRLWKARSRQESTT